MPRILSLLLIFFSLPFMALHCENKWNLDLPIPSLDIPGAARADLLPDKPVYAVGDTIWLNISLSADDLERWPSFQQASYTLKGQLSIDIQPGETGPFEYVDYMTWVFPEGKDERSVFDFTYDPISEKFLLLVGWKVLKPRQYKLSGDGLDLESDTKNGARFQHDAESVYLQATMRNNANLFGYIPVVFSNDRTTRDILVK